jgi:hypothetical protein
LEKLLKVANSEKARTEGGTRHAAFATTGISYNRGQSRAATVGIFRTYDPFIRSLRKTFAKAKSVEGMRLGGQTFGDRFVEDAYAYRIS